MSSSKFSLPFFFFYSTFLAQHILEKGCMLVAQSCPTLCDSVDCCPPGYSNHGILQARILEWIAIPFSRGSSWLRDWLQVSCTIGRFSTIWSTREAPEIKKNQELWHQGLLQEPFLIYMTTEETLMVRVLAEDPVQSLPLCPLLYPQPCFTEAKPLCAPFQRYPSAPGEKRKPSAAQSAKATGRGWSLRPPGAWTDARWRDGKLPTLWNPRDLWLPGGGGERA